MHNLESFITAYGIDEFRRTMEIHAPETASIFIERLHTEIEAIVTELESARKERSNDSEDRLSVEIVNCLKSAGYFAEKDPTHGGHVDFLVSPKTKRAMKWYGEAKIWSSVGYLEGGIDQLLGRYASGRERFLGFFIYFKSRDIAGIMNRWLAHLNGLTSVIGGKSRVIDELSFITCHKHDAGTEIQVRHFAVNIYWNPPS